MISRKARAVDEERMAFGGKDSVAKEVDDKS
jgi:hypothetical protein